MGLLRCSCSRLYLSYGGHCLAKHASFRGIWGDGRLVAALQCIKTYVEFLKQRKNNTDNITTRLVQVSIYNQPWCWAVALTLALVYSGANIPVGMLTNPVQAHTC